MWDKIIVYPPAVAEAADRIYAWKICYCHHSPFAYFVKECSLTIFILLQMLKEGCRCQRGNGKCRARCKVPGPVALKMKLDRPRKPSLFCFCCMFYLFAIQQASWGAERRWTTWQEEPGGGWRSAGASGKIFGSLLGLEGDELNKSESFIIQIICLVYILLSVLDTALWRKYLQIKMR